MAIAKNREVYYSDPITYVEHKTGKKVKSIVRDYQRMGRWMLFEDKTVLYVEEGAELVFGKYQDYPKSICVSCGEEMHVSSWDWQNRCSVTLKKFWEKVRKVYWHRYLKNK